MTAKEAALFTEEGTVAGLAPMLKAIKKAAKEGSQYSMRVVKSNISTDVIKELEYRQFAITDSLDSNKGKMIEISWEHFKR